MKQKTSLVILILSLLISAELVLVASLVINRRQVSRPTLVPTIALNGEGAVALAQQIESVDSLDSVYPSDVMDDDLWERQTGEALLEMEDELLDDGWGEDSYPSPDFTPYGDSSGSDYQSQPMDSWSSDDFGQSGESDDGWDGGYDWSYPAPADPPAPTATTAPTAAPTSAPTTATLAATATSGAGTPVVTATSAAVTPTAPAGGTPSPTPASGSPSPTAPAASASLNARRVDSAPVLNGVGDDPAWEAATEFVIETQGGANDSAARVTVKAVYDDQSVYFLLTWEDPGPSFLRNPWEMQSDGSWKQMIGPDGSSDESIYAEDKVALMWPVTQQPDFTAMGCGIACHAGENPESKTYGNKYMPEEGQTADLWVWKSVRNLAQVDDLFLDGTRYSDDTPAAGRHGDPRTGGGYANNEEDDQPVYMPPSGGDKTGAPGYILNREKVDLDDSLFEEGERLPSVVTAQFEGDRGDIAAGWRYANGRWTLELSRRLVTGSIHDVQFDDLDQAYAFGLATFDNTQLRHAVQTGSVLLRFEND